MAQLNRTFNKVLYALHSSNLGLNIFMGFETIALDVVGITAITNFAVTIKNNSVSGNITKVIVYVSPDGANWLPYILSLFSGTIGAGLMDSEQFTMVGMFVRISVQSDSDINIDIHLDGNLT
jgi:hypothetical protein